MHGLDNAPYFELPHSEKILADSLLYRANLKFLQAKMMPRQPFVNYILTMQGHYPYARDPEREPTAVSPRQLQGVRPDVVNVANLFYHRTCALADFLTALQKIDPQSLVLAISDHLPPDIIDQDIGYPAGHFMNVAMLLDRFKPIDISQKKYYEIAHELWRRLSSQSDKPAPVISGSELEALYLSLHAESITPVGERAGRRAAVQSVD